MVVMAEQENQSSKLSEEQPPPRTYKSSVGFGGDGKSKWPELVGLTAEEAEAKIKEEMPGAVVKVIPPNHILTADFRTDRVRIHVDAAGKVFETPSIG